MSRAEESRKRRRYAESTPLRNSYHFQTPRNDLVTYTQHYPGGYAVATQLPGYASHPSAYWNPWYAFRKHLEAV